MLKNHILTHNVVGMQKSIQALLEKHFNRAIRRMPMLEDVDTENVEPQVISSLIRYAHENKSPSYSYESGLFSADFTSKADLTSFMEIIHDYYWVRHYEVDMEVTDDMTSLDLESLPDDAEGNFTIHVEIDSSIVQYPCGYVDEERQVINEKAATSSPQADCDDDDSDYITETAAKKRVVIRDGKKTTEMQCPKGTIFNPKTKQCRKMKSAEIKNRHLAGLRTARANKSQMKAITVKRNRSRDKAKHI